MHASQAHSEDVQKRVSPQSMAKLPGTKKKTQNTMIHRKCWNPNQHQSMQVVFLWLQESQ